eukprot:10503916-Alexandrium_andersonii.AAC.1
MCIRDRRESAPQVAAPARVRRAGRAQAWPAMLSKSAIRAGPTEGLRICCPSVASSARTARVSSASRAPSGAKTRAAPRRATGPPSVAVAKGGRREDER